MILKSCRGVAIYLSNKINATELLFDIQFKEHLWISIPLLNNDSLTIGCIYRTPTAQLGTMVHISRNVALARTRKFACGLINHPKNGMASVSFVDIMKHTQGCTLTSKAGVTPPPSAIIKPRANPQARANATLQVICTVVLNPYIIYLCCNWILLSLVNLW